jgi:hypothetical protein
MKLTTKTFDNDYWNNDFNVHSLRNNARPTKKRFLKRALSSARRIDAKETITTALKEIYNG